MISKISHKKKIDVLFLSAYKRSIYMIANKHEECFVVVSWINFLLQSNPFYAVTLRKYLSAHLIQVDRCCNIEQQKQ